MADEAREQYSSILRAFNELRGSYDSIISNRGSVWNEEKLFEANELKRQLTELGNEANRIGSPKIEPGDGSLFAATFRLNVATLKSEISGDALELTARIEAYERNFKQGETSSVSVSVYQQFLTDLEQLYAKYPIVNMLEHPWNWSEDEKSQSLQLAREWDKLQEWLSAQNVTVPIRGGSISLMLSQAQLLRAKLDGAIIGSNI
jgi:hypothetical protein